MGGNKARDISRPLYTCVSFEVRSGRRESVKKAIEKFSKKIKESSECRCIK